MSVTRGLQILLIAYNPPMSIFHKLPPIVATNQKVAAYKYMVENGPVPTLFHAVISV